MAELLDLSFDEGDEAITVFTDGQPPVRLPARRPDPEVTEVRTADTPFRICIHELARALEEFARKEYVPLFSTTAEFEVAAGQIADRLTAEKCPLKGGHG